MFYSIFFTFSLIIHFLTSDMSRQQTGASTAFQINDYYVPLKKKKKKLSAWFDTASEKIFFLCF